MKKRFKQSIIIVMTFTLILTSLVVLNVNAKGESKGNNLTTQNTNSNKYNGCTVENALKEYNISHDYVIDKNNDATATVHTSTKGELRIVAIDEGEYNEDVADENIAYTKWNNGQHVKNISEVLNKIIYQKESKNGNPKLKLSHLESGVTGNVHVRLTLEVAKSDTLCASKEEYENAKKTNGSAKTVTLYYYIPVPKSGVLGSVDNNMRYSDACKFLRGEIQTLPESKIGKDIQEKYKKNFSKSKDSAMKLMPFCNINTAKVVTNYTEAQLYSMLSSTLITVGYMHINTSTTASNAGSSEAGFDYMKNMAYASGHVYENTKPGAISQINLRCKYNSTSSSRVVVNNKSVYNYENKNYYYATTTINSDVTYHYNFDGIEKDESKHVCSKTCEEAVEVSYGPPQAAIAGFCFEYQVKVVSRVQCHSSIDYSAAPEQKGYCTPEPVCEHKNGVVLTQAGPTEEFDACIQECDGGKYTQSCSNKCYNKIYGDSTKKTLTATIKPVANVPSNGKYVRSGTEIIWQGTGYARWYRDYDDKPYNSFFADGGFKRKHYNNTDSDCDGVCHNSGCGGEQYLNPESASRDYQDNLGKFQEAVAKCQAGATCQTNTSTYNIQVSYKNEGKDKVVKYTQQDLTGGSSNPGKDNKDSILLSYDGCYNSNAQDYYKSEWSFPGTWVNNKTGEISFTDKNKDGWHKAEDKFCLPLDAGNENSQWWNWYMAQKKGTKTSTTTGSYMSDKYQSACVKNTSLPSENTINWNIKAKAEGFGYFKWNFFMECFYASNNSSTSTSTKDDCITDLNNYEVRQVTNKDLFPTSESSGEGTTIGEGNYSNTGRDPGFNWTEAAAIPANKNKNYAVNPSILIGKIQRIGNEVYTKSGDDEQEYLDYEFNLSPSELNKIRNYNKLHDYNDFGGSVRNVNDVNVYESNLFRSESLLPAKAIKKLGKIGCNNQANSSNCLSLLN